MLTTIDNPYNPFTEYAKWDAYDQQHGYHTSALLGRVVVLGDDMSEADTSHAIKLAIDEIVSENVSGIHTTVTENFVKSSVVENPYPIALPSPLSTTSKLVIR